MSSLDLKLLSTKNNETRIATSTLDIIIQYQLWYICTLLPVFRPQKLELTAANSTILIDNIDIFRTNGFEFEVDEEGEDTPLDG